MNLDTQRTDADRLLKQFHPTFDVRFDPAGDLAESYEIEGMPTRVLIDRHGVRRQRLYLRSWRSRLVVVIPKDENQ